jgi:hypothetical protein
MRKGPSKHTEKRRGHRQYASGVLEFYDEAGVFLTGSGRLLDLSTTGAKVETGGRLIEGQVLRLRLRLEGSTPLELMAKVARVFDRGTQPAYGLQFGELSSGELRQIKALL